MAGAPAPFPPIPRGWPRLSGERDKAYFRELEDFVAGERIAGAVYPPPGDVFKALVLTPCRAVRVVLLGQDPYHGPGQAHGLAFSVPPGVAPPPSLRNLLRELREDLGVPAPAGGSLVPWARRGVLLLNTVLTVRKGSPGSHAGHGWEQFTDAVIERVNAKRSRVVFLLLGGEAQKKAERVDGGRHAVVEAPHPSPLSAHRGFFGSRIFSRANALLREGGRAPVEWGLPG